MKVSKRAAVAAALVAAAGVAVPTFASNTGTTKSSYGSQPQTCSGPGGDNVAALTGPQVLWPPNHKFVDESATATNGTPSLGDAMLTVTPVVNDLSGGDGDPQHDTDYMPGASGFSNTGDPAVVPFQLRAERSGGGAGRTYTINWYAKFNDGTTCGSMNDPATNVAPAQQRPAFTITVPHDQRKQ